MEGKKIETRTQIQCFIPVVLIFEIAKFASWRTANKIGQTCHLLRNIVATHISVLQVISKFPLRCGSNFLSVTTHEKEGTIYISFTSGNLIFRLKQNGEITSGGNPILFPRLLCVENTLYTFDDEWYTLDLTQKNAFFMQQEFEYTLRSSYLQYLEGKIFYSCGSNIRSFPLQRKQGEPKKQKADIHFIASHEIMDFALATPRPFNEWRGLVLTKELILHNIKVQQREIFYSIQETKWDKGICPGVVYDAPHDRLLIFSFGGRELKDKLTLFSEYGTRIGEVEFNLEPLHVVTNARLVFPSHDAHFYAIIETTHQENDIDIFVFALKILDYSKID